MTNDIPRLFDRALLRRRLDRAAPGAARHDFLLDRVADDFAERLSIVTRRFDRALAIDAYHGLLGRRLQGLPNVTTITNAGLSPALSALCTPDALAADHEALDLPLENFDLALSGLSLHLANDLPGALVQLRRILKPDGLLLAALLGGETLTELRQSWLAAEAELTGGASPRVAPFADIRSVGALLQRAGFALPVADLDTVRVTYETPLHLMRELKGMGASNMLHDRRRVPVTRALLARACEIYAERFPAPGNRVHATFEIITLTAWVPHESQPRPARPGSATASLADALRPKSPPDET